MPWYLPVLKVLQAAWAWLKKDYNWVWVVLFPLGIVILVARFTSPRLDVVSSELVGADKKREDVQRDLAKKDAEARADRDKKVAEAQQQHDKKVDALVDAQQAQAARLQEDTDALTAAMLKVGKDVRR